MPKVCDICDGVGLVYLRQFNRGHGYWYFGATRCSCGSPAGEGDFYDEPLSNKERKLRYGMRYWNKDMPMLQPHEVEQSFSERRRCQFELDEWVAEEERKAIKEESHEVDA